MIYSPGASSSKFLCRDTYRTTAARMILDSDSPRILAIRNAGSHTSSSICVVRIGVVRRLPGMVNMLVTVPSPPQSRGCAVTSHKSSLVTSHREDLNATKPHRAWTASAGFRSATRLDQGRLPMQSVLVATAPSSGFTYTPSCDAHHASATFAVEFDDLDGEGRREVFCALCLGAGVDYAMNRSWFTPPTISRIVAALVWTCARCGEDPTECPVVDGRCVRDKQVAA